MTSGNGTEAPGGPVDGRPWRRAGRNRIDSCAGS